MGCLKFLIKLTILVLAFIGFKSLGGVDFVAEKYENITRPSQEVLVEKSKKIGDFSNLDEDYILERSANLFGYSAIIAEHKESGQKLVVAESKTSDILSPEDFESEKIDQKLIDLSKKHKIPYVTFANLEIGKKGHLKAFGKNVSYVNFHADVKNLPAKTIDGIIGAVRQDSKDGNITKVLVAVNFDGEYSQKISDNFFKQIK